jgi:hypothetical protein
MDHSMQILGDGRSNTGFRYTQPLQILIIEASTIKLLLCS